MEKPSVATEKRAKTSINLKQSLRNAAIKHLIDLTGETEVSKAVEMALELWLSGKQPSTSAGKGPLPLVVKSLTLNEPFLTEVSAAEHETILKLLRILRGGDRRTESAIRQIIESTAGHTEAPEVPRLTHPHGKGRSEESGKAVKRSGGDKKPSA